MKFTTTFVLTLALFFSMHHTLSAAQPECDDRHVPALCWVKEHKALAVSALAAGIVVLDTGVMVLRDASRRVIPILLETDMRTLGPVPCAICKGFIVGISIAGFIVGWRQYAAAREAFAEQPAEEEEE